MNLFFKKYEKNCGEYFFFFLKSPSVLLFFELLKNISDFFLISALDMMQGAMSYLLLLQGQPIIYYGAEQGFNVCSKKVDGNKEVQFQISTAWPKSELLISPQVGHYNWTTDPYVIFTESFKFNLILIFFQILN